jgi:hypothetical protein
MPQQIKDTTFRNQFIKGTLLILAYMAVLAIVFMIAMPFLPNDPELLRTLIPLVTVSTIVLFVPYMGLVTKWTFAYKAEKPPIPLDELKEQLRYLNKKDTPYAFEEKRANLWVMKLRIYENKWRSFLYQGRIRRAYALKVRFNPRKKEVILIDTFKDIVWARSGTQFTLAFGYFVGIAHKIVAERRYDFTDLVTKGDPKTFVYNSGRVKNALVQHCLDQGWGVRLGMW